jgi:hypothetical protein
MAKIVEFCSRLATKLQVTSNGTRWLLLSIIATCISIGVGVSFLSRTHSEWDDVFLAASKRLIAGESLYPPGTNYSYPPFSALLGVPLAKTSGMFPRAVFYFANLLSIAVLLVSAAKLSHGSTSLVHDSRTFWLGIIIGFPFVFHTLAHQQTDLLVAALCLGGCYFLQRDRVIPACLALGLAAAMKCTPLLFVPYLVVKGRLRMAAAMLLVAVCVNLIPDLINRPTDASCQLAKWCEFFISPMMKPDHTPGVWASEIIYNQSIVGAVNRWYAEKVPVMYLKRATYFLYAGLGSLALVAMIRSRQQHRLQLSTHSNTQHICESEQYVSLLGWECSIVLAGMLLLSPMSSVPHFATMLLPGWLMARAVVVQKRWELLPFLLAMLCGSLASNKDLLGRSLYTQGLWYGSVMWLAVAAFLGSFVALAFPKLSK